MERADDVDHHGRYACPGQHLPQQLFSVDRVVGLLEVDEAHVQRDFPLSTQFLESADYEEHADGGSRRPESALLLRQYLLYIDYKAVSYEDYSSIIICVGGVKKNS